MPYLGIDNIKSIEIRESIQRALSICHGAKGSQLEASYCPYSTVLFEYMIRKYPNLYVEDEGFRIGKNAGVTSFKNQWEGYLRRITKLRITYPDSYMKHLDDERILKAENIYKLARTSLNEKLSRGLINAHFIDTIKTKKEQINKSWWVTSQSELIDVDSGLWLQRGEDTYFNGVYIILNRKQSLDILDEPKKDLKIAISDSDVERAKGIIEEFCTKNNVIFNRPLLADSFEIVLGDKLKDEQIKAIVKEFSPECRRLEKGRPLKSDERKLLDLTKLKNHLEKNN